VRGRVRPPIQITNCHTHTFTSRQTPDRFLPWPVTHLARFRVVRRLLTSLAAVLDPERQGALGRYAQILDTSFQQSARFSTRRAHASSCCR